VFLFAVPPFEHGCPACRVPIEVDHIPPSWRHQGRGRNATQERSRYGQWSGAKTATGAARERPRFEPESSPPERRVLLGDRSRGGASSIEDPAVDVGSEDSLEGLQEIAPLIVKVRGEPCGRCERYGPGHGGDHIPGWDATHA
jgi:hypothetical protein